MSDDRLEEIAQKLGVPGGQKLYQAARKRGLRVTKEQVRQFVRKQGQKQIFRPLPASAGKNASESEQMRAQMDLIDLKFSASKGFKNVLAVVNVWNRMAFAIPIVDKTTESVANGLRTLLNDPKLNCKFIFSDAGNEWRGPVQILLDEKGIVHRTKEKDDVNALAVIDRFIQTFKFRLAESLAANKGEWADRLPEVVRQYNESPHETLFQEAPNDLGESKVATFMNLQENARKLAHNQNLFKSRKQAVQTAGAFRRPLEGLTKFKRGFQATYGALEKLEGFEGSKVKPQDGDEPIDVKRVLPVDKNTRDVEPGFALGRDRTAARREKIQALALQAINFVGNNETSLQRLAAYLKFTLGDAEYRLQLMSIGAQNLSDVIRLVPELSLTRGGYYVKKT